MLLTIGMIVRNEEKYLEKCLTAIQPIRDNVDCELIITDTGSTDRTVEIAERFADKVIHYEWTNDFSAARNTTIKAARGEWFMFLDADDIFRSCDGIIGFFNSGEYKQYNSASYTSHNLTNDVNVAVDYRAPRLTKLKPETRFVGVVHEALNTYGFPVKNIYDVADHYGYIYENEEQRQAKNKRNTDLLLLKLERDKNTDPIIYIQLFQNYMGMDRDKAFEYINKGIDVCKQRKYYVLAAMYSTKAFAHYTENDFEAALSVCDEYFAMDKSIRPGELSLDIEVYAVKASALYSLGQYEAAAKAFEKFFDTFYAVKKGKINTAEIYATQLYLATDSNYLKLAVDYLTCCVNAEMYRAALEYMAVLPVSDYSENRETLEQYIELELKILRRAGYDRLETCAARLDGYGRDVMRYKLFFALYSTEDRKALLGIIERISSDSAFYQEKCGLYRAYYDGSITEEQFRVFADKYPADMVTDLFCIALDCGFDISCLIDKYNGDVRVPVYTCSRLEGFYEAAEKYPAKSIADSGKLPGAIKFFELCMSMRLVDNPDASAEDKQRLIGRLFAVKSEMSRLYRESSAEGGMSEFEKLAAAVKANIRRCIAAGDYDSAEKNLGEYMKLAPGDAENEELYKSITAGRQGSG